MNKIKTKLDKSFVKYIIDQIQDVGEITYKYMFGGCAIYCCNKVVALVCNNQLFIRPTQKGEDFIGIVNKVPPYSGAKPHFLVEDKIDEKEWLAKLIKITSDELSEPKFKKQNK